jgi:hypothetical protein
MLDPDPVSMNSDSQHCFYVLFYSGRYRYRGTWFYLKFVSEGKSVGLVLFHCLLGFVHLCISVFFRFLLGPVIIVIKTMPIRIRLSI